MTTETGNEKIRFLRSLRAVREYTPEPVSEDTINSIVEVGRWAGSSSNSQPTEIIVVRDRKTLELIGSNGAGPATKAAVAFLILTAGNPERRESEAFDNGRLVERLLLACKANGLGANIATLKNDGPELVRAALGIPAEKKVWTVVTAGHIDWEARKARPANPNAGRKDASSFAHWEKY
jgi:nitroreductase